MSAESVRRTIWVPLGYSITYRNEKVGMYKPELKDVLGEYDSIQFHTLRLGRHVYQATITRKGVPPLFGVGAQREIVDVVAGLGYKPAVFFWFGGQKADMHQLSTGEYLSLLGIHEPHVFGGGVGLDFRKFGVT